MAKSPGLAGSLQIARERKNNNGTPGRTQNDKKRKWWPLRRPTRVPNKTRSATVSVIWAALGGMDESGCGWGAWVGVAGVGPG